MRTFSVDPLHFAAAIWMASSPESPAWQASRYARCVSDAARDTICVTPGRVVFVKSHFSIPFVVDRLREDFHTDKFTGHKDAFRIIKDSQRACPQRPCRSCCRN